MIIGRGITLGAAGQSEPVAPEKDVNFIDYDGSILYSYTAGEFAALTALPPNPSHSGLTAQGWNWTLEDAQSFVASCGMLTIGQMYVTQDGATRLTIRLEEGRASPYLGLAVNGTASVDWGDGSSAETVTGTATDTVISTRHTYAAAGEYVIAIAVTGTMAFLGSNATIGSNVLWNNAATSYGNRYYQNALRQVEIGSNCTIGNYAFVHCNSLSSVVLSSGVTKIGSFGFQDCHGLRSVSFPRTLTGAFGTSAFQACYSLESISMPKEAGEISGSVFSSCYRLSRIIISGRLGTGGYCFQNCFDLTSVVYAKPIMNSYAFSACGSLTRAVIESNVSSIGSYAFQSCNALAELHFKGATPATVDSGNAWSGVPTDCKIYVPAGSLSDYTSASNYPDPTQYTYIEYSSGA